MPTNAGTSPEDVRVEIDTTLSDGEIFDTSNDEGVLNRVKREINRAYESGTGPFQDSQHRQDFEAALAALRIAEGRDRRASDSSSRSTSVSYEADEIAQLRKRVRRDDPGNVFGHAGNVRRDDGRYISSTTDS